MVDAPEMVMKLELVNGGRVQLLKTARVFDEPDE